MNADWQIERVEINEAFAAVPLAVEARLGLPEDVVNIEGGAIAHGHPIGATGAILTTRIFHSMRRYGLKRGLVTLCIGGGQGIALLLETIWDLDISLVNEIGAPALHAFRKDRRPRFPDGRASIWANHWTNGRPARQSRRLSPASLSGSASTT
jgi:hypothetical protein